MVFGSISMNAIFHDIVTWSRQQSGSRAQCCNRVRRFRTRTWSVVRKYRAYITTKPLRPAELFCPNGRETWSMSVVLTYVIGYIPYIYTLWDNKVRQYPTLLGSMFKFKPGARMRDAYMWLCACTSTSQKLWIQILFQTTLCAHWNSLQKIIQYIPYIRYLIKILVNLVASLYKYQTRVLYSWCKGDNLFINTKHEYYIYGVRETTSL